MFCTVTPMTTDPHTVNLEALTQTRHLCQECVDISGVHEYRTTPCTADHDAKRAFRNEVEARQAVLAPKADRVREEAERITAI